MLIREVRSEDAEREADGAEAVGWDVVTIERTATPEALVEIWKHLPFIEKAKEQPKSTRSFAPSFLRDPDRFGGLFVVCSDAIPLAALIERQLRQMMQRQRVESLPCHAERRSSVGDEYSGPSGVRPCGAYRQDEKGEHFRRP